MADDDRVVARGRERAPGAIGDLDAAQALAGVEDEAPRETQEARLRGDVQVEAHAETSTVPGWRGRRSRRERLRERLLEVVLNVAQMLDADRDPDELRRDAGARLLGGRELLMGGRGRVDDQGLRVADVREMTRELHRVDEPLPRLESPADAEGENAAEAVRQIALRPLVIRVRRQAGIAHPLDRRMGLEPLREPEGVVDVALHAQAERLQALQEEERVERRERRPEVAQPFDAARIAKAMLPNGPPRRRPPRS